MITYSHAAEKRMEKLEAHGITPEALGITSEQALHHLDPSRSNELRELWKQDKKRRACLMQFLPEFADLQKGHSVKAPNGAAEPFGGNFDSG